jgi:adenylate kinase family enzyme
MARNKTAIITIGIPGAGKSTWANNYVKENTSYVRINRDDLC